MIFFHVINAAVVAVVLFIGCSSIGMVRGTITFESEIKAINDAVEHWYKEELNVESNVMAAVCLSCEAHGQSKEHHWPRQMMKVLQLATGVSSSDAIDEESLVKVAAGLRDNDEQTKKEFQAHLEKASEKKTFLKITENLKRRAYSKLVDHLCDPYRSSTNRDFVLKAEIERLIRLKEYENIDDSEFYKRVVYSDEPISQVYTAAMICQLIQETSAIDGHSSKHLDLVLPIDSKTEIGNWPYPSFQGNSQ